MRRWIAGFLGPAFFVVTCAVGALAQEATVESRVVFDVEQASLQVDSSLTLPLSRLSTDTDFFADNVSGNELFVRHTLRPDGTTAWGAHASFASRSLSARLFLYEPHDSSSDPFRLIHSSVRHKNAMGVAFTWSGAVPVHAQYVSHVPLRQRVGPLMSMRIGGDQQPLRLSTVLYGSDVLRHRFIVLDGAVRLGSARLAWGAAQQDGVEQHSAEHGLELRPAVGAAGFVRVEGTLGRHRGWVLLHATSPSFRSLAASRYPYRRGATGLEGRWQWRPATNQLLSVLMERRWPREDPVYEALEASFSVMPRGRWGWRAGWDGSWEGGSAAERAWTFTVTSPSRRLEQSVSVSTGADGGVRRQLRLQVAEGSWRVRLAGDDRLRATRVEWRWAPAGWTVTVIYKARQFDESGVATWLHASFTRDVGETGQWWIQWGEPDQGRLDVGWSRPDTIGAGVRVSF